MEILLWQSWSKAQNLREASSSQGRIYDLFIILLDTFVMSISVVPGTELAAGQSAVNLSKPPAYRKFTIRKESRVILEAPKLAV